MQRSRQFAFCPDNPTLLRRFVGLAFLVFIGFGLLLPGHDISGDPPQEWKIENLSLVPDTSPAARLPAGAVANRLTVSVLNRTSGVRFDVSSDVRMAGVKDSFTFGNKLVAMDDSGNASTVVVFDLIRRQLIDWFYCYAPRRISENWIAYVEWYPAHATGEPKEIVLVYDLARAPAENRLPSARRLPIPAPITAGPTQVGIPVFPESNARLGSYLNMVEDSAEGDLVLQHAGYVLLPGDRLVFAAAQGHDFPHMHDYLVVVDLSRGVDHPTIDLLDIPKDQLQKPGENPQFVQITGMEQASENAVRLFVPAAEYGVSSIVVNLTSH